MTAVAHRCLTLATPLLLAALRGAAPEPIATSKRGCRRRRRTAWNCLTLSADFARRATSNLMRGHCSQFGPPWLGG